MDQKKYDFHNFSRDDSFKEQDVCFEGCLLARVTSNPHPSNLRFSGIEGEWDELYLYEVKGGGYACRTRHGSMRRRYPSTGNHMISVACICKTEEEVRTFFGVNDLAKRLYAKVHVERLSKDEDWVQEDQEEDVRDHLVTVQSSCPEDRDIGESFQIFQLYSGKKHKYWCSKIVEVSCDSEEEARRFFGPGALTERLWCVAGIDQPEQERVVPHWNPRFDGQYLKGQLLAHVVSDEVVGEPADLRLFLLDSGEYVCHMRPREGAEETECRVDRCLTEGEVCNFFGTSEAAMRLYKEVGIGTGRIVPFPGYYPRVDEESNH